jgi:MOSC domain-containing protein YiiM
MAWFEPGWTGPRPVGPASGSRRLQKSQRSVRLSQTVESAPHLVSVNVGLPRDLIWHGINVTTGIFKDPVRGRVPLRRLNLDGDRQADLRVHGGPDKAVYAYDLGGYEYWRRELGVDFPFGQFGENLTVEGMPETEVRIGDAYRIGTVLLQVSQPRSPCFKLALKMERPAFLRAFLASGRTGFYLRVLEEGEIGVGDEIRLVSREPESVTVERMTRRLWPQPQPQPQSVERN